MGKIKIGDIEGEDFSIYETHKKTNVLVTECFNDTISMYRPKPDKIPYKDVEGKSITSGKKIFDSRTDSLESINIWWNKWTITVSFYFFGGKENNKRAFRKSNRKI